MTVNEPRRNDETRGIDFTGRRRAGQISDGGDAVAGDADIGTDPRRTRAINDTATTDEDIEGHGCLQSNWFRMAPSYRGHFMREGEIGHMRPWTGWDPGRNGVSPRVPRT